MFDQIKAELLSSWQGPRGGDGTIAHAAWASTFDAEKLADKTDDQIRKVVTNVVDHHHDTPKERLWMEFFITCPIFVERQFDKYRMTVQYQDFQVEFVQRPMGGDHITQNELSGRYRTIPGRPYFVPRDVGDILTKADNFVSAYDIDRHLEEQWNKYKYYLDRLKKAEQAGRITNAEYKRAREVIRGILGTSFLTDMRICMNLNAFEHIINQRLPEAAQPESNVTAYWMVKQALDNEVAKTGVQKMIEANGWQPMLDAVEKLLEVDK